MIELTLEQSQALEQASAVPVSIVDPRTQQTYVLLRSEEYQRLQTLSYDDTPWTDEEKALLATESGSSIGWNFRGRRLTQSRS